MMPDDVRLAEICENESYHGPWRWESPGHTRVACVEEGGYTIIAPEGTTLNGKDIIRDMRFFPWRSHSIGFCPAGFLKGMQSVVGRILVDVADAARTGRLIITGHSLGGAIAEELAGVFCALDWPPAKLLSIEPPFSGSYKLRRLLRAVPDAKAIRCGNSPVTLVPYLPGVYVHPLRMLWIGEPQADIFACHRISYIRQALVSYRDSTSQNIANRPE